MTMKIQKPQNHLPFLQSNKKNQFFYESWLVKTY